MESSTLMFLICRLPSSCRDMRGSFPSRLTPSFSQLMEGMGSPDAWHFKSATLSTASVWLDGPWRIMGGGLSVSTAEKTKTKMWARARVSVKLNDVLTQGVWLQNKLSDSTARETHRGWMWLSVVKWTIFSAGLVIAPQNNDHILSFQEAGKRKAEQRFLVPLMWRRDAKQFPVTALFLYTSLDSVVQFGGETLAHWLSVVQINTSLCAVWDTIKGQFQLRVTKKNLVIFI